MGKGCSFNGKLCIWKNHKSQIIIGEECTFISNTHTRNLVGINRPCILNTQTKGSQIIIGKNCGFSGTVISSSISVEIKDNVKCGANTQIMDSDWHPEDPRSGKPKPVFIGNNVWLGMNAIVLKGVSIGENAVIGANSVVTKSIPANTIAAGNPCQVIKKI
jgi:acetyltransferase-like isoleucine patch superfamily enzyme